ncbi:MAG: MFS transporter [Actinomycetaceae bacterium]|nr:MFS transporter [Actinomycetaceae bacterium]
MSTTSSGQTALQQIDSRPLTRNQKNIITLVIVANIAEFFDIFLTGFVVAQLQRQWELTGTQAGIILACAGLGTVIGATMWGYLADRIGRRRAFFWCVLGFTVPTALSVATPEGNWVMLALLRILVGMGVGGLNITSIPYVQEFVPAKQRGLLSGLASVFIPAGLFLGSLAQRVVGDNWRMLLATGVIPIFLLLWLRLVPESPRYYLTKGRTDDARKSLAWALEVEPGEVGELPKVEKAQKAPYSLIFTKHFKSLSIITVGSFCFILGSFTVQSWGQSLLQSGYDFDGDTVAYMFMVVSGVDLLGRLLSAWLADRIGRRWTMFSFGIIGAIGCVIVALAAQHGLGWQVFFLGILITMGFGDGAFGILNAFGSEQFPNEARSTGLGLGYGIGSSAKVVGPYLMGWLIGGNAVEQNVTLSAVVPAFFLFAALLVLGAVTYMFAKETKGRSLEEV